MNTFSRFFAITLRLIPPFTSYFFNKSNPESEKFKKATVRIRVTFQTLGSTFIKLGQMLSARPDIVGPELSSELRNLLDKEPTIPESQVKSIIETELDAPIHEIFEEFDMTPLASASIGQVHKAKLHHSKKVAVKIQRPHIEKQIQSDLRVFKIVTSFLDFLAVGKQIKFSFIYQEFSDWITNELDFQVEGRRADKFRENMQSVEGIVIPEIFWKQTRKKVLVMEFLEGVTLNSLLNEMKQQGANSLYELKTKEKLDPDLLIKRTIAAVAKQILSDRYFHGDLHPANIIVQHHNTVALIDFGIVGTLDNKEYMEIVFTILALVENDPESLLKAVLTIITQPLSKVQTSSIQEMLSLELHKLHEDTGGRVSLNHLITTMFSVAHQYDMLWTPGLLLAIKTIGQIDSVAAQIGIKEPLVDLMKPEVEKYVLKALSTTMSKEQLFTSMLDLFQAGRKLPDTLSDLEKLIQDGELIKVQATLPSSTKSLSQLILTAAGAGLLSFPVIASGPIATSAYKPVAIVAVPLLFFIILSKIIEKREGVK